MWGREAGGPRARVGPAWSGGRAAARGKGSVCEQPGQQRGLGRGSREPGAGDTLPWGVCSPTPSNRRQLRAGGRGAAVSGAGGVLTCWAPKLTSRGGGARPDPVMSPGHPAATTLWPALGTPSSSQPGGTPQSSLPCREPPPPQQKTQAPAWGGDAEEADRQKERGTPNPGPRVEGRGPQSERREGPCPAQSLPLVGGTFPWLCFRDGHPPAHQSWDPSLGKLESWEHPSTFPWVGDLLLDQGGDLHVPCHWGQDPHV